MFLFSKAVPSNPFDCSRGFCSLARGQDVKSDSPLLFKRDRNPGCTRKRCHLKHNEELHNLNLPPNIARVAKLKMIITLAIHRELRCVQDFCCEISRWQITWGIEA